MDHREVGLHHKVRGSADHSAVTVWQKERELDNLPDSPDFVDLRLQVTDRLGSYQVRKIWREQELVVLRLVSSLAELSDLQARLDTMSERERLSTAVILAGKVRGHSADLGSVTVVTSDMFLLVEEEGDSTSKDNILISILAELSTYYSKVVTLPSSVSLEEIPAVEVSSEYQQEIS